MITVISPAKTMDFESTAPSFSSKPIFQSESEHLINLCKTLSLEQIKELMLVSDKIAKTNYTRFQMFYDNITPEKQAIYTYNGDVYNGIQTNSFNAEDIKYAQNYIRILSGLYGILRPMDLIKPYRLEMGTRLEVNQRKGLYQFWRNKITSYIIKELESRKKKIIINLASNEYSSVIDRNNTPCQIIDIVFKETKNNETKIVPIKSKRARGVMTNFIIKEKITNPESLKAFEENGYRFNESLSSIREYVFVSE
jgi:cytoplasmic iron level regulating protein YaaA (DUF328/UPF0246 family)